MTSIISSFSNRIIGTVELVSADRIEVLLNPEAPQVTALNTGKPLGFPRINSYVLIPNEIGATVGLISSVRIERSPYPKRKGTERDFGLVDLPFPTRRMVLTPLGTITTNSSGNNGDLNYKLRFIVTRGVDIFPSVGDPVLLPTVEQLQAIVEGESADTPGRILLGHCPTAGRAPVYVDPNKLFGRHLAILGNTGAGKSCTVAGLIRWAIEAARRKKSNLQMNARFIVLDPNGEYAEAFKDFDTLRLFQVNPNDDRGKPLKVPAWLWNGEEWAVFTDASPGVQRPILFEALRRLRSGQGKPETFEVHVRGRVKRYRDRLLIALQNTEHQGRGQREGFAQVLINIKKDFDALAQNCEQDDLRAKIQSISEKAGEVETQARSGPRDTGTNYWHNDFAETDIEDLINLLEELGREVGLTDSEDFIGEDTPRPFAVEDLPDFVDTLAANQSGRDIAQFVDTLTLRIRGLLSRSKLSSVLYTKDPSEVTLEKWLNDYLGNGETSNGNITVIDLSLIPSEVVHIVVSVLARMIFEAVQRYRRETDFELPTVLVVDEAHTFIHRDLSGSSRLSSQVCSKVFERIAREGRKFGLGLVLASQRPSELSPTVLSQCNTFLLHRIVNDRDQDLVKRLVPDALGGLLRELPSLPTRRAILLGWAVPAPVLVEIREIPEKQRPHSPDPNFWGVWVGDEKRPVDWKTIAERWQNEDWDYKGTDDEDDNDTNMVPDEVQEVQ